jgi:glycosyltransferase involved in cell wall biosynthesis
MNNNDELHHMYSKNISHKRICIIGPCPPPLGGVSVHIKRVIATLQQQNNIIYQINPEQLYAFDFLSKKPFKYVAQFWYLVKLCVMIVYVRPHIVMYHSFCKRNTIPELVILSYLKKIIVYTSFFIEHDCRHMYERTQTWQKKFTYYLKKFDHLVCIGNTTYNSYQDNTIDMPTRVTVESAFLPPVAAEEKFICATYPQELFTFLNTHTPIIVVNAFKLTLWHDKDLYGIDQTIEMVNNLKKTYEAIGLVIVLGSIGDEQYYQILMQRIDAYNLQHAVFIMCGQKELWPLLKYATVFVRPTLSDSYGISIAEALYVGTSAVASDVCKRPAGTILYKAEKAIDLAEKVRLVLCKDMNEKKY